MRRDLDDVAFGEGRYFPSKMAPVMRSQVQAATCAPSLKPSVEICSPPAANTSKVVFSGVPARLQSARAARSRGDFAIEG